MGYPIFKRDLAKKEASKSKPGGKLTDEEAKNLVYDHHGFELFGLELPVYEAYEPSNIIWENQEIRQRQRNKNKCYVFMAMAFILLIIVCAVTYLKIWATKYSLRYPK